MTWVTFVAFVLPAAVCGQMLSPQQPFSFPFPPSMAPNNAFTFPGLFPSQGQQAWNPMLNPNMMMMMGNPGMMGGMGMGMVPPSPHAPSQLHHAHAGRPSAPDVTATAESVSSEAEASVEKKEESKDQPATKAETQESSSLIQSYASTMLGSLQSLGKDSTAAAHQLFVPPYSWAWRVAMTLGSLKYDNMDRIADVPELMNLITGYYAGAPDALAAAKNANTPSDRFALSSLPHLFQGPASASKQSSPIPAAAAQPLDDTADEGAFDANESLPENIDDDEDDKPKDAGLMSSIMNSVLGGGSGSKTPAYPTHTYGGHSSYPYHPHLSPPSSSGMGDFMSKMMAPGAGGHGKGMSPDMIKMMGNMVGANPTLVNMAAPMIGSML